MSENDRSPPVKVWYRNALKNRGSLLITIPGEIRRQLNWHQNAPFIVTLEGDHMEVRQVNLLQAAGVPLPGGKYKRRKKHWSQPPQERGRREEGYPIEPEEPPQS